MTGNAGRYEELTFARFLAVPENASALAAVREVLACFRSARSRHAVNPLFLHGPAGTGKSHLVSALVTETTRLMPGCVIAVVPAADWAGLTQALIDGAGDTATFTAVQECDLLVVEDVQTLQVRATETLVRTIDALLARERQIVLTANAGPLQSNPFSARLTSRLGGGLVVGLSPLQKASRLAYLEEQAQRRQIAVHHDVLAWLAEELAGGGRQLNGALTKLATLALHHPGWLSVADVAKHFHDQIEASQPTVERIVQRVGTYFQVEPRLLQSERRSRSVVVPRQVSMYLARKLTSLSLTEIGSYFGDRDHSTVLHACRKVEKDLALDAVLSSAVKQIRAELQ